MRRAIVFVCIGIAAVVARAASADDIEAFAQAIERPLRLARYMEGDCTAVTVAGWEGYETRRCSYAVKDRKTGSVKPGLVVLLNPSSTRLSMWIFSACKAVRPSESLPACANRLFHRIIEQSGGQFPVAGIVYEDILPADGVQEAYGFASGVTTILTAVQHRRTEPFSPAELEAALIAPPIKTASEAGFARIAGVTRSDYSKAHPSVNVAGLNWLAVVRDEHQKAMTGDRNALLDAWLAANAR